MILRAPTPARLFDAAAGALLALGAGDPAGAAVRRRVAIALRGASLEDLLVRWLQELLFLQGTRGWRFREARVTALDRRRLTLRGVARGAAEGAARRSGGREIKAVTYHDLRILRRRGAWRARVVFDV